MNKIKDDIKTNTFEKAYLLYGDEPYMRNLYKKKLKNAIVSQDDSMNLLEMCEDDLNVETAVAFADTMPFFAEHRLIVIENSGLFNVGKKNASETEAVSGKGDVIAEYLKKKKSDSVFVFIEEKPDKRSKLFKTVSTEGHACELNRLQPAELIKFAGQRLNQAGKVINAQTVSFLIDRIGNDMENIVNETDKLIAYVGERKEITMDDISEICIPESDEKIYYLTEAIARKDKAKALRIYKEMSEGDISPMAMIYSIQKQYRNLLTALEIKERGGSKNDLVTVLGLKPYPACLLLDEVRLFDKKTLLKCIDKSLRMEEEVKKGNLSDQLAVELLLV